MLTERKVSSSEPFETTYVNTTFAVGRTIDLLKKEFTKLWRKKSFSVNYAVREAEW